MPAGLSVSVGSGFVIGGLAIDDSWTTCARDLSSMPSRTVDFQAAQKAKDINALQKEISAKKKVCCS